MDKQKVIVVVGPTGVGKTQLSIEIAKRYGGEVISGDSMQIYKSMDIGTAKVTKEEQQGIPHHLIDIRDPDEHYSAADFQADVEACVQDIAGRGKLPIIAGGTGLYIQAALYAYDFSEAKRDDSYQQQLEQEAQAHGPLHLHKQLQAVDPVQAERIHPNNVRRVIRALEIFHRTGKRMSDHEETEPDARYDAIMIGLDMDRDLLYEQINLRVDKMLAEGLLEEVKRLVESGIQDTQSMRAIGYKEFIPYLEGKMDWEDTVDQLKQNSRRYAKRQYTWFRNKMNVDWYSITPATKKEKFRIILEELAGKLE
ncbi:tRNA (adenosine(37)-N6)-dimethylallyltransferase MiaA [Terribacillus saccharophilus]|uniref:tRNA (adenosine(37)-N6)-dimethylallyltransferase MiaA n=1 Tax=Terribacillus saccharophilus TaxID=361277 RepID=UPI002DCCDB36|nr:tRNA (adenosine(37)-N6)-dimethylallyltransferase MiaA [Terribacillus saccharophilus]MEC0290192.1 tRNA (adenosine(37)-N6)-dimethylallyltransferase MiaA [Terribacillus saccharophilus]